MTTDSWKSLIIKILLMILTPLAAQLHLSMGPMDLSAIAADIADLAVLVYGIYRSSGMKLVPHAAVAIEPHAVVGAPVVGATVGLPVAAKVVGALLVALALALLALPQGAMAAQRQTNGMPCDLANLLPGCSQSSGSGGGTTGVLDAAVKALSKPFTDLANFIGDDNAGAIALSTVVPEIQDGHGQQCWMAMSSFGKIVKAHPVPVTFHITTDFETLRLLGIATNNLCSNVHCTQVFADATAMAQAASPMPLAIPSLHDLCTKVPQIAVVAPVTVPAPAGATADPAK